jgi:hypothetical protein
MSRQCWQLRDGMERLMKKVLPLCLLLAACQTDQPTVESINAAQAAREAKCEHQGVKRGTSAFYSCTANYEQIDKMQATNQANQATQTGMIGAGGALIGLSLLGAFSDERLKRNIVPIGVENGYKVYRFKYLWSDAEYVGVMAQEVQRISPEAVTADNDGLLHVDYYKIGVRFRPFDGAL